MAFVNDAVALHAATLSGTATSASTMARAEYAAALHAVIYAGPENRFYFAWNDASPKSLADHLDDAWRAAGDKYGANPPVHAYPKNRTLNSESQ